MSQDHYKNTAYQCMKTTWDDNLTISCNKRHISKTLPKTLPFFLDEEDAILLTYK